MKLRICVEGRSYEVDVDVLERAAKANGNGNGRAAPVSVPPSVLRSRAPQRLPEDNLCRSPIAGRVSAILAPAGRQVRRHQPVVLIEAMKMEIPIGPAVEGTVKIIHVQPGEAVCGGQILFELS